MLDIDQDKLDLADEEDIDLETLEKQHDSEEASQDQTPAPTEHKPFSIPISKPLKINNQDDLNAAVEAHAVWLESVINPRKTIIGGRANFKDADLRGYDLSGVNLSAATFTGANLEGVDLTGSNFTAADFTNANLQGAKASNTRFKKAILNHANLVDADLSTADMTLAQTHGATFVKVEEQKAEEPKAEEQKLEDVKIEELKNESQDSPPST